MKLKCTFETYRDDKGEHRWRVKSRGRIIAESGEGYKRKSTMRRTIENFIDACKKDDFLIVDKTNNNSIL